MQEAFDEFNELFAEVSDGYDKIELLGTLKPGVPQYDDIYNNCVTDDKTKETRRHIKRLVST